MLFIYGLIFIVSMFGEQIYNGVFGANKGVEQHDKMSRDGDVHYDNEHNGQAVHRDLSQGVGLDHLAGIHDQEENDGRIKVDIKYCIG